jgi:hypothetical protein
MGTHTVNSAPQKNQWDEAAERVQLYLMCLKPGEGAFQIETAADVLREARRQANETQVVVPLDLVMETIWRLRNPFSQPGTPRAEPPLVPTAPELRISSMTSRPVDYGPLVELELLPEEEWASLLKAALFWLAVYAVGYFFILRL